MHFSFVLKTLVIQNEKSHLQAELERAKKELAEIHGKAVSCIDIN